MTATGNENDVESGACASEGEGERERAEADRGGDASVRAVRAGHGANCSSIGSVVDILFAAAAVGTALFAAVSAALASEPIRVAGPEKHARDDNERRA
jgi:hypothetical protein